MDEKMTNCQDVLDRMLSEKQQIEEELRRLPKHTGQKEIVLRRIRLQEQLSFLKKMIGG